MKIETELTKTENIKEMNKKLFMFLLVMIIGCTMVFAAGGSGTGTKDEPNGMDTIYDVFQTIYAFFTSSAIRIIAIAGVIFTGVKIITNKGNPEAMKSLVPIFIACIIIGCASWFVSKFMGSNIGAVDDSKKGWWTYK